MHPELEALLVEAETRYLKAEEMAEFKRYVVTIGPRLKAYELLRDKEVSIFQFVARELQDSLPNITDPILERTMKHWLLILRHCAMAMLIDDQHFLSERLLGWLSGFIEAYHSYSIEITTYDLLISQLKETLSESAFALLEPFLTEVQVRLLANQ